MIVKGQVNQKSLLKKQFRKWLLLRALSHPKDMLDGL